MGRTAPALLDESSGRAISPLAVEEALGLCSDARVGGRFYERFAKPALDRFGAAILLLVALPAIVAVALAVRICLGPGVIFRQRRVGRGGVPFTIYKFRTMRPGTPDELAVLAAHGASHKRDDDPRHTPLGRFLRKWSLDELPQLWNVLRGGMSLVGPRPELTHIVDSYEPWQRVRHVVKPGLTGLWQVTTRGAGPMQEFVDVDVEYVRQVSMRTDLKLLLLTVPAMLRGRQGS